MQFDFAWKIVVSRITGDSSQQHRRCHGEPSPVTLALPSLFARMVVCLLTFGCNQKQSVCYHRVLPGTVLCDAQRYWELSTVTRRLHAIPERALGFFAVLCAFHGFLFFIIAYKVKFVNICAFAGIWCALLPTFHCPFTYIDAFFFKKVPLFLKKTKKIFKVL